MCITKHVREPPVIDRRTPLPESDAHFERPSPWFDRVTRRDSFGVC